MTMYRILFGEDMRSLLLEAAQCLVEEALYSIDRGCSVDDDGNDIYVKAVSERDAIIELLNKAEVM